MMRPMRVQFKEDAEVFGASPPRHYTSSRTENTSTPRRGLSGPPARVKLNSGAKRRPLSTVPANNSMKHRLSVTPPQYAKTNKKMDFQNSAEKGKRTSLPKKQRPEWDSTIHDLSKLRASKSEIRARKLRYTSRNNFIARADLEKKGISVEQQEDVFNQILTPKKITATRSRSQATSLAEKTDENDKLSEKTLDFGYENRTRSKRVMKADNYDIKSANETLNSPEHMEDSQKTPVAPATQRKKKFQRLGSPCSKKESSGNGRIILDTQEDEVQRPTAGDDLSHESCNRAKENTEELRQIYETLQHQVRHFERVAGVVESDDENDEIESFTQDSEDSQPEPLVSVGGGNAAKPDSKVSVSSVLNMCSKITKFLETSEMRRKQEEEARAGLEAKVDSLVNLTKSLTLQNHISTPAGTSSPSLPLRMTFQSPGVGASTGGGGLPAARSTPTMSHADLASREGDFDRDYDTSALNQRNETQRPLPKQHQQVASPRTPTIPGYSLRTPRPVKVSTGRLTSPLRLAVNASFAPVEIIAPPTPRSSRSSPNLRAAAMAAVNREEGRKALLYSA